MRPPASPFRFMRGTGASATNPVRDSLLAWPPDRSQPPRTPPLPTRSSAMSAPATTTSRRSRARSGARDAGGRCDEQHSRDDSVQLHPSPLGSLSTRTVFCERIHANPRNWHRGGCGIVLYLRLSGQKESGADAMSVRVECPSCGRRLTTSKTSSKTVYCGRCLQTVPIVRVITDREGGGSGVRE